ncbi:siderophore-interacting protein [Microlunatus soli]|uniref:NADPH-dependent ferric siderophore reductase, contains FAD-binding and SIP domains n=1 Tax=Microlunatus soli TaxID=630515 RepID=A0A1H1VEK6_9ACTN|nr:siderophore-interacting protein [Microlunatus soli]SDS83212.1 NADPH-dependent ferric siderophore reductase, contains FAD-binding and SIP domains [Microlunatus soli]
MSSQPAEPAVAESPAAAPAAKPRRVRSATVVRKEWLTPDMVRVYFTGPDLADLPELTFTDHYVKILFPPEGADYSWPFDPEALRETLPREQWPVTRTYTIRSFDRAVGEMAIDFVVHGDAGLAGPWAAKAEPGAELGFRGPGGAYAPESGYDTHLLVGDEAAIPAIAAALDRLPAGSRAIAYLEVADPDHEQPLPGGDQAQVVWVHRDARPYGEPLAQTVREHGLPEGSFQTFVHGNAGMIKDLRRYLFVENGVDRRQVSISGYWRTGQNEDAWQSGKRDFMAGVEAEEAAALTGR